MTVNSQLFKKPDAMMRFLFLIVLVFLDTQLLAKTNETLVADYTPFLKGQPWPCAPVIAYVENTSNVWVHPSAPKEFPMIQEIHDGDSDFTTVVMRFPDGSTFKTYNEFVLGPYLSAVYSGDFNGDGIPDFMFINLGGRF